MNTNETNPINLDPVIPPHLVRDINMGHRATARHIRIGSEGSLALEQVRLAQYARTVADLRRALDRLVELQARHAELALGVAPMPELDELKAQLGLP